MGQILGCAPIYESRDARRFSNPDMRANSRRSGYFACQVLCPWMLCWAGYSARQAPGFAKCAPNPGMCTESLPISQSRDARQFPCPGTLRRAGYSARQVPGFAGCTPISESRDACHSRVLRNAHPILGCAPNPSQFPNLGMRANSRVPGRFAKQVTPLAKSRVLRDAHQFPNPGMRADFILFFFTGIIVPNWTLSKIGKTNQSPSCFRLPREMKISYLLSKMLQVIFIGINETRQGAQNKKKWSSFSAIGTSISSDAPIPVSRDASPSRLLRSPSPGFCGMRTNFRIPGCVPILFYFSSQAL